MASLPVGLKVSRTFQGCNTTDEEVDPNKDKRFVLLFALFIVKDSLLDCVWLANELVRSSSRKERTIIGGGRLAS